MNKPYSKYNEDLAEIERKILNILDGSRYGNITIVIREGKIRCIKKEDTYLRNNYN